MHGNKYPKFFLVKKDIHILQRKEVSKILNSIPQLLFNFSVNILFGKYSFWLQ